MIRKPMTTVSEIVPSQLFFVLASRWSHLRNVSGRWLTMGPSPPGPSPTAEGEGRKCVWRRPPVSGFLGPGVLVGRAELTNPWDRVSRFFGSWRWVRMDRSPWAVRREALFHVKHSARSPSLQCSRPSPELPEAPSRQRGRCVGASFVGPRFFSPRSADEAVPRHRQHHDVTLAGAVFVLLHVSRETSHSMKHRIPFPRGPSDATGKAAPPELRRSFWRCCSGEVSVATALYSVVRKPLGG